MRALGAGLAAAALIGSCAVPAAASWRPAGPIEPARSQHTATELRDGRVLVAGGSTSILRVTPTARVYDPGFDPLSGRVRGLSARRLPRRSVQLRFAPPAPAGAAARMRAARGGHTATLMADGRVLVAGGMGGGASPLGSAEVYDARRDSWAPARPLAEPRAFHSATGLPDGRVLVAGGIGAGGGALASAEVYDPSTNTWTPAPPMGVPHANHTATALADGRVLVAGGDSRRVPGRVPEFLPTEATEVYDPATGAWASPACPEPAPSAEQPSPCLHVARSRHTATALPGTGVLAAGGLGDSDDPATAPRRSAELYDSATGTWTAAQAMGAARAEHTASLLPGGSVLVAGGRSQSPASAEAFGPGERTWRFAQTMDTPRRGHTATPLQAPGCRPHCGEVLVVGGRADAEGSLRPQFLGAPQLFSASGSPSLRRGVPARSWVVKQSRTPIRGRRDFDRAQSLCRRVCRFPAAERSEVTVTVTRLRPRTTYYYAVMAVDGRRRGPLSNVARVTTRP